MPDETKATATKAGSQPTPPPTEAEQARIDEAQAKLDAQKDEERIARDERKGYNGHAKGLGLISGGHYLVVASNPLQNLAGTLIRTSDLGVVLKPDNGNPEHSSFFPWHNVVALHKAVEPPDSEIEATDAE